MQKRMLFITLAAIISISLISVSAQCAIAGEAPTIELEIYDGPDYSEPNGMCYYRLEATVTGIPDPEVTFGDVDNVNPLGSGRVEVGVEVGDSYTLTATASNTQGTASASITLKGGCEEEVTEEKDEKIVALEEITEETDEDNIIVEKEPEDEEALEDNFLNILKSFMDAVKTDNEYMYFSSSTVAIVGTEEEYKNGTKSDYYFIIKESHSNWENIEIETVDINGDVAVIEIIGDRMAEGTFYEDEKIDFRFLKENGEWKIDFS